FRSELETDELAVSVGGSGSSDPDGQVTSYVWDFGDGGSATGVTASHTYAEAGPYEVTLTVTDDAGATAEVTREVTVAVAEPPNAAPVAAFELETDELAVSVDGSGSSDPDGQVTSYVWGFGDGGSAAGVAASHTYAAGRSSELTLTVTDDAGATAEVTREVTVAVAEPPNAAPVAAFELETDELAVSVDGSGSSDPDGQVTSYVW